MNVILSGASGRMGKAVRLAAREAGVPIAFGIDISAADPGYAFSSLASGLVLGRPNLGQNRSLVRIMIASLLGFVLMYIPGVFHFMRSMDKTLKETMALCVLPYLPGDAIKMVLCIVLAKPLRKTVSAFVFDDDPQEENEDR